MIKIKISEMEQIKEETQAKEQEHEQEYEHEQEQGNLSDEYSGPSTSEAATTARVEDFSNDSTSGSLSRPSSDQEGSQITQIQRLSVPRSSSGAQPIAGPSYAMDEAIRIPTVRVEEGFTLVSRPSSAYSAAYSDTMPNQAVQQMELILTNQFMRLDSYRKFFMDLGDEELTKRFSILLTKTSASLDQLKSSSRGNQEIPKYSYDAFEFIAMPVNPDLRDRELRVSISMTGLQGGELEDIDSQMYVVAEFDFPPDPEETYYDYVHRKFRQFSLKPSTIIIPNSDGPFQIFKASSIRLKPFDNPNNEMLKFEPPISFYIEKSKAKTLKRKFKPLKLTFYKKCCISDKKVGKIQFKIDEVNDESTLNLESTLKKRRFRLRGDANVEAEVRVREPLVEKEPRPLRERFLLLLPEE